MSSSDPRPAKYSEFNSGEGLIQDRVPIIKKEMFEGQADNPNNIVILVGPTEEKFVVNKCLAKLSSRLLENSIVKATEPNEAIKFPEILPKYFLTLLECAVLGINWKFTNLQETCRLLETAAHFGFHGFIEDICTMAFQEAQSRENIFDDEESLEIILFQSFDFRSLREKAVEYILENASSIFRGNRFLELSFEDFGWILIQDKLKVESEIEVLNALIRWGLNVLKNEIKLGSKENLRNVLAEPLNWVRFPNIKESEFRDYVIPLQILTDEQVNAMELWYKNGNSVSGFINYPRDYSRKVMDSKANAANHPKSAEEFLHATQMDNLLAKFSMNIQIHDVAIENAQLKGKIRQLKPLFGIWRKIIGASKFCEKLEALTNPANKISDQEKDELFKIMVDKFRKNEDFSESLGEIEDPEGINLQLLESVNETMDAQIAAFQRVKCSETYEPLSWKLFQNETDSTVVELQKFANTQSSACAIIFRNNTFEALENFQIYTGQYQVYIALPSNIQPFCTHNYGQTSDGMTIGILSYDIGSKRVVIRHNFREYVNDFGIAIAPLAFSMNEWDGWRAFTREDWTNDSTKIKALCEAPTETEKCIKLENLFLHAELIGTGPKVVLRGLLTAL